MLMVCLWLSIILFGRFLRRSVGKIGSFKIFLVGLVILIRFIVERLMYCLLQILLSRRVFGGHRGLVQTRANIGQSRFQSFELVVKALWVVIIFIRVLLLGICKP